MASPLTVPLQLLWLCLLVERVGLVTLCLQARFFALWPAAFIDLCRSRLEAVAVAWALVLPPTFCLPGGGWVVSGPWYLPFFHCCPDLRQVFGYAVPGLLAALSGFSLCSARFCWRRRPPVGCRDLGFVPLGPCARSAWQDCTGLFFCAPGGGPCGVLALLVTTPVQVVLIGRPWVMASIADSSVTFASFLLLLMPLVPLTMHD